MVECNIISNYNTKGKVVIEDKTTKQQQKHLMSQKSHDRFRRNMA